MTLVTDGVRDQLVLPSGDAYSTSKYAPAEILQTLAPDKAKKHLRTFTLNNTVMFATTVQRLAQLGIRIRTAAVHDPDLLRSFLTYLEIDPVSLRSKESALVDFLKLFFSGLYTPKKGVALWKSWLQEGALRYEQRYEENPSSILDEASLLLEKQEANRAKNGEYKTFLKRIVGSTTDQALIYKIFLIIQGARIHG